MSDQSNQSNQSDHEDDMSSDAVESPSDQYPDEAETDRSDEEDKFFDLEAEESASSDEDDEDEYYSDDSDDGYVSFHDSFPQFVRLPAELRVMIWEAVDPDLKCKGRVLDFNLVLYPVDIWESATLARQTAPARKLLAASRESRCLALKHYPDVIEIREGHGKVRFNSSRDIILLRTAHLLPALLNSGQWYCQIKNLAVDYSPFPPPYDELSDSRDKLLQACGSLKAVFFWCEAHELGPDTLGWSVAESSKKFYLNKSRSKECDALYCWPDTESADTDSHASFFPPNVMGDVLLTLPLVQYTFDQDLKLYNKVKRRYGRDIGQKAGSASPLESSEGESFYESELDDYALDGFVVDGSSDGNEEPSDDEDLSDEDGNEDDAQLDQDPGIFNGFSPLQEELGDDEATGNLPNATVLDYGHASAEHHLSDEQSLEEQPRSITQTGRRKRHIVSSDDEDDGEGGGEGSAIQTNPRVKKRARVILSDSEDDEDRSPNGAGSDTQGATRRKQRAFIVHSDSEDGEEEGIKENESSRPPDFKRDEDEDEDEEGSDDATEDEDDDEESEGEPTVSKPTSLLARLRQFRSDVPISPEGGSPSSNLDEASDEEEQYEDNGERRFSDAEFPDSAAEDDEEDGW